jgi:hypothetical protein
MTLPICVIRGMVSPFREVEVYDRRTGGNSSVDSARSSSQKRLRDLALSETAIMDVVLATAARCFFSKTLALVVGRAIADA